VGGTVTGFPGWALPLLRCPHCRRPLAGVLMDTGGPDAGEGPDAGGDGVGAAGAGWSDAGGRSADRAVAYEARRAGAIGAVGPAGAAGGWPTGGDGNPAVIGCPAGHRFDVARQGYLPLLGPHSRTDTGDTAAMVAARASFLDAGWYAPIARAVAAAVAPAVDGPAVEVGAGTGYYLAAVTGPPGAADRDGAARTGVPGGRTGIGGAEGAARTGLALDSSRYAVRRAARLPGVAGVLAAAWSPLPVADRVAAAVLSVFAPRNPAELARILLPGGRVVVVTPAPDHLTELRNAVALLAVDEGKSARVAASFAALAPPLRLVQLDLAPLRYPVLLPRGDVGRLVAMGPTARHLPVDAIAVGVARLPDPVEVTVSVDVTTMAAATGGSDPH
jgi:23S rRNA (guanine745-N1)-methyltransferase